MLNTVGWGQTESSTGSDILLKANIPIVSKTHCEEVYNDRLDKDNQLCAGYAAGGYDVCLVSGIKLIDRKMLIRNLKKKH